MMDMPIESILHFQENKLEKSSTETVAELLEQAHRIP